MEFQEVVRRRRMVRTFTSEPVADSVVARILRNATRGPSAGFSQGQEYLVLAGPELARFWGLGVAWVHETVTAAPLVIVPFAVKDAYLDRYAKPDKGWTDRSEAHWPVPYWYIDTGMAAMLMLQTVVDEGLGALFFGLDPQVVAGFLTAFGVPAGFEPIGGIAIGHPSSAGDPVKSSVHSLSRRSPEEVVHYGSW